MCPHSHRKCTNSSKRAITDDSLIGASQKIPCSQISRYLSADLHGPNDLDNFVVKYLDYYFLDIFQACSVAPPTD